ncbi:Kinase [Hexamita inflata]|uniref:CAMKK n=1 Tax=Hexamita inflata TaxID=28002 RepID=A0AA86PN66_9EUKA|nr:CAMKK [Hexamita inflata]
MSVSNYILGNSIGRGSFGSVYYCIHKETNKEYAVKVLSKSALQKQAIFGGHDDDNSSDDAMQNQLTQLYKEIKFMKKYPHPLFMNLQDVIDNPKDDKIYVVLEIAEGIIGAIHEDPIRCPVPQQQLKNFPQLDVLCTLITQPFQPLTLFGQMHQTSLALQYLHSIDYIHGDLKQANILRMTDGRYTLADFGLTQPEATGKNYKQGVSPAFSAPESAGLTKPNDVWGYGVIFFMNLMGFHPAALVALYCIDNEVKYQEAHWGKFIQKYFKEVKAYFMKQTQNLANSWIQQFQQIQKLYGIKPEIDSVQVMVDVAAQISFQCFATVDKRPTMNQIAEKLSELNCKYHATKLQKYFVTNQNLYQSLLQCIKKLSMKNPLHLNFILKLNYFKHYKQEYLDILDTKDPFDERKISQVFCTITDRKSSELMESTKQLQICSPLNISMNSEAFQPLSNLIHNVMNRESEQTPILRFSSADAKRAMGPMQRPQSGQKLAQPPKLNDSLQIESDSDSAPTLTLTGFQKITNKTEKPTPQIEDEDSDFSVKHTPKKVTSQGLQLNKLQNRGSDSDPKMITPPQKPKIQTNLKLNNTGVSKAAQIQNQLSQKPMQDDSDSEPKIMAAPRGRIQTDLKLPNTGTSKAAQIQSQLNQKKPQLDDSDSEPMLAPQKPKIQTDLKLTNTGTSKAAQIQNQLNQKKPVLDDSDSEPMLSPQKPKIQTDLKLPNTGVSKAAMIQQSLNKKQENVESSDSDQLGGKMGQLKPTVKDQDSDSEPKMVAAPRPKIQTNLKLGNTGVSKAAMIQNQLSEKKQIEEDSDSEPMLITPQKPKIQTDLKLPTGQSKAAQIQSQLAGKDTNSDSDTIFVKTKLQADNNEPKRNLQQLMNEQKGIPTAKLVSSVNTNIDSDSDSDLMGSIPKSQSKPSNGTNSEDIVLKPQTSVKDLKAKSVMATQIKVNPQTTSQKIPVGIKIPQTQAAMIAAKFAQQQSAEEDQSSSSGPMDIRPTKPIRENHLPPTVQKLNIPTAAKTEVEQLLKVTPRNLNLAQSYLVQHDDLFANALEEIKMKEELANSKENLNNNSEQYEEKQSAKYQDIINLEQRQNFFLKLNVHFENIQNVKGKDVSSLFKQIGYQKDTIKQKKNKSDFIYDHDQDQNRIIGLGSFEEDTLSAGKRDSDGGDDFSSDDDLVEIGSDPESVVQQVNEALCLNIDNEVEQDYTGGLLQSGRGKFKTLQENEPSSSSDAKLMEEPVRIEQEEQNQMYPNFLSARVSNKQYQANQGASLLPFLQQNTQSSKNLFSHMVPQLDIIPPTPPPELKKPQMLLQIPQAIQGNSSGGSSNSKSKLKPQLSYSESSDDLQMSMSQQSTATTSYAPNPFFALNLDLNISMPKQPQVDKLQLFDVDSDDETLLTTDQRLTSRLQVKKKQNDIFQPVGPVSARQETKQDNPEKVDLTSKQSVIFMHNAIIIFNMMNHYIMQYKPALCGQIDYIKAKQGFEQIIQKVQLNQPLVMVVTLDDLLLHYIIWKDCLMKNKIMNPLSKHVDTIVKRIETVMDNSPAFLRPQCGWVLHNTFTIFKDIGEIINTVNAYPGNEVGFQLSINNQLMIQSSKSQMHDVQLYIGLEKAECTPVVGVRHKSDIRTLCVQLSDRMLNFQEQEDILADSIQNSVPIYMTNESMSNLQKKYFSFKFTKQKVQYDYNQYQTKKAIYSMVFLSLNKQVVMPYVMIDVLLDLLFNSRNYSKPSQIRASLFNSGDNFYFIISDAGCGISEEQTENIFRSVDIGGRTHNAREFGNGSGLAKLRLIVGLYSGGPSKCFFELGRRMKFII